MKKSRNLIFAFVALLLVCVVSCKKEKQEPTEAEIFVESLTQQDTVDATAISTKFMQTLQAGNLDEAFDQLVLVDTAKKVLPLPEDTRNSLRNTFTNLPVIDFVAETFQFMKPDSNIVVFSYAFAKVPEGQKAPTTRLATMPMKIDGKWYLTLPGYLDTNGVKTNTDVSELATDSIK